MNLNLNRMHFVQKIRYMASSKFYQSIWTLSALYLFLANDSQLYSQWVGSSLTACYCFCSSEHERDSDEIGKVHLGLANVLAKPPVRQQSPLQGQASALLKILKHYLAIRSPLGYHSCCLFVSLVLRGPRVMFGNFLCVSIIRVSCLFSQNFFEYPLVTLFPLCCWL